jgi:hypothetical protein
MDSMDTIEEREPPLFVCSGEQIRFTSAGIARYGARFARSGINIRDIKTREAATAAMQKSFRPHWEALVAQIAAKKPANPREGLERECLVAIALDDSAKAQRLLTRIQRLNSSEAATQ